MASGPACVLISGSHLCWRLARLVGLQLAGAAAAGPAAQAIDAVVFAMQGVAVGLFAGDQPSEVDLLSFFERLARNELFAAEVSWTR